MAPRIQTDPAIQQLAQRGITEKTGIFGEHRVQIGTGSPIRLDKIKANSIPFQGFRTATKVARGHEGLAASSCRTLDILKAPGTLKAHDLLAALKTNAAYRERLDKLGQLSEKQKQDSLWSFAPAVERLSNTELAAVYQVFTSAEMDLLQTALDHETRNNPKAKGAASARDQLFDLQALVLKEMSNRVSNGILDDLSAKEPEKIAEYNAMRPGTLSLQYADSNVLRTYKMMEVGSKLTLQYPGNNLTPTTHDHDITAGNLHVLANVAAESATLREKSAMAETQKLSSRGMAATPREIGDLLRQSPLTINVPTHRLLRDNAFFLSPNEPMPTVFHMQQKGILSKGAGYMAQRNETEKLVFPEFEGHDVIADERPVYGALNTQKDQSGPAARAYGSCCIILKPEVARRATFIAEDTFYSPAISITPERKANLYKLLDGSGLSPERVADFKDPQSQLHQQLETELDLISRNKDANTLCLKGLSEKLKFRDEEKEWFTTICIQAFGDQTATRAKLATYDNLESLLPGLNDLNGAMLAQAAEKSARGEAPSVRLAMNYIEAQIHGPLIPGRDIQEMRVNLDEVEDPAEQARLVHSLDAFSRETGVKITYLASQDNAARALETTGTFVDFDYGEEARQATTFDSGVRYYAQHVRSEVERALDDRMGHIQDVLREEVARNGVSHLFPESGDILRRGALDRVMKAIPDKFKEYMLNPSSEDTSPADIVTTIIRRAVGPTIKQKADLLRMVEEFPLNRAQKDALSYWVRSSLVRKPAELRLAFENAQQNAEALRTIAEADPPLSVKEMFLTLAEAAGSVDERTAAYAFSLPPGSDYGTDDKNADRDRSSFLAFSLLKAGEPPFDEARMRGLHDRLHNPEMRSLIGQLEEVIGDKRVDSAADFGLLNTVLRVAAFHLKNASREVGERYAHPAFSAEPSLIPENNRAIFRQIAPEAMDRFDKAHEAYTPFPVANIPEYLPVFDTGRRGFLVDHLDAYLGHEQTFDRGRSTHGRGHVARAYIFASAMCSILEEQGVPVDRNAVLCGITGHDIGRKKAGKDAWEQDSAAMTVAAMRADFGADTLGEAYERELIKNTTKSSDSVEGMILKSADALDIGRVTNLNMERVPFLRGKEGEENISGEALALRKGLEKEANLLQRLTDPLCENREALGKLDTDKAVHAVNPLMVDHIQQQKDDLLGRIAREYEASWTVDADRFMANMENLIRENPQMFPVLSRYYR